MNTARFIFKNYKGKFPTTYNEIVELKGVGPYTAAAIASFCFNLPYAVIDGNVFRILSRVFGIATPVDTTKGKKQFKEIADKILDKKNPGLYNQAIMDFGATVCKPMLPLCAECMLNKICKAYETAAVNRLPVKEKVLSKKKRWFSYFIFNVGEKTFVRKRTEKDIWQNLFEFYLVESESDKEWNKRMIADFLKQQLEIAKHEVILITTATSQQLTHQHIKGYFIVIKLNTIPAKLQTKNSLWLSPDEMTHLPFPAFINQYFETKNIQPSLF